MKKTQNVLRYMLTAFLITAASVMAVTEQEVQNMRQAMPDKPVVEPAKQRTMLVFSLSNGFQHGCIPYWAEALEIMGQKTGAFTVVHSKDMNVFTPQSLSRFDVICFNNTTKLVPDQAQQKAIMDFITGGKGIVGIHAATDNFDDWPQGAMMMGGVFTGHPWTAGGTWAVKIDDPDHPLTQSFGGKGFKINDEIYRTLPPQYARQNQRVLMSLDMSDEATRSADGVTPEDMDTGISWIKSVGKGRLFYCSLGHNPHLTWNKPVLAHYLAGIQYAAGDLKVDDSPVAGPNPAVEKAAALIEQISDLGWDDSRAVPLELEQTIRSCSQDAAAKAAIETKLLNALKTETTPAAKDLISRQLAWVGSSASVPVLSGWLDDPDTSNMARYALEKIPGRAVDAALLKAADTDNDTVRIGIISTLAARRSDALVQLARDLFADSPTEQVAAAMVWALGRQGSAQSADILMDTHATLTGDAKQRSYDALLQCAGQLRQAGRQAQAKTIYQKLYQPDNPSVVRAGALTGLVQTDASDVKSLLTDALNGQDWVVRTAAIQSLAQVSDTALLSSIASGAGSMADREQVQLVTQLAQTSPPVANTLAMKLIGSDSQDVRIAAYRALEQAGDASAVEPLAKAAATARSRDERNEAQQALYRMSGAQIDAAILDQIASADNGRDDEVVVELINAAAARRIDTAPKVLFKTAASDSRRIASASLRAIQTLAEPQHAPALVDLIASRPNAGADNVLLVVAEKMDDTGKLASMILEKYAVLNDTDAKAALLRVLGRLGTPRAADLLQSEFAADNETLREAAFRAMADWPGDDFLDDMKKLAQDAEDARTKILAFRAYVRMLENSDRPQAQKVSALIDAFAMAERPDERRIVIGALGGYGHVAALRFVKDKLDDSALKAEAAVSLMQIAEKLLLRNPSAVKPVLQDLKQNGTTEAIRSKAGELLERADRLDGFVYDWQVSGPYTESGTSGQALFDVAFAPETDPAAGRWTDALNLVNDQNPPILDLARLAAGDDRVAYLKTTVSVDETTPALLQIGSDDGVKVWLNGTQVHAANEGRAVTVGEDKVNVTLKKGANPVLVKVVQRAGNWGFSMKITDTDNNPLSGVQVDAGN